MIYELAGIVGLDPGPFTLRELVWMAEARRRDMWDHTAGLLALLYNINRDPKRSRAMRPEDFHPLRQQSRNRKGVEKVKADITALKQIFVRENHHG